MGILIMISSGYCYESDKNIVITKSDIKCRRFDFESKRQVEIYTGK